MPDLLLELFSEEIPARMQRKAAGDLKRLVTNGLVDHGLTYDAAKEYWTPRRLTLDIRGLTPRSKDIHEERKGPSTKAPEQAINGFLRSTGLQDISQAEIMTDPKKGDFYIAKISRKGRSAEEIIADIMPDIIRGFPWPKSMRWGSQSTGANALRWIRPLKNILCVFGSENEETAVVPFEVGGLASNNLTFGHRFLSEKKAIEVRRFEDYVTKLENEKVILDGNRRKEIILSDARNLCFAKGLDLVDDEALAEEVSNLVEWPVVLMGEFEESFLAIPAEIIQLTIRINQKCFVTRKHGQEHKLSNHFVLVSNIVAPDGGKEIAHGNAKVVRARLSDALYFWHTDQHDLPDLDELKLSAEKFSLDLKKPLDQRMARLDHLNVTFHAKLGTQGARVERIAALATTLASLVGAEHALARRAAVLAKADLQTEAVGEFPELQGVMGHKYALLQGEDRRVAQAIEDHYKPQGPTDRVPRDSVSIAVALADKIDTLVGFWLIDEKPTGSKDPFALRRACLGVIRLLLARDWTIHLMPIFRQAISLISRHTIERRLSLYEEQLHNEKARETDGAEDIDNTLSMEEKKLEKEIADKTAPVLADLLSFFHERLKVYLKDEGARHDAIDAVLGADADDLLQVARRVEALISFINTDDGRNLLVGSKRAFNILEAEIKKSTEVAEHVDPQLFIEKEEAELYKAIITAENAAKSHISSSDFSGALIALAVLRQPVDAFFEKVLVNDENKAVRANRLALLRRIPAVIGEVADF
ncbi:glycine--tRNA ligase subunit beta, partial [uncultured Bartonella sp.]|uniref:glycine--tRNA ligase subunit beta n=1 Tax=uncultured Bartonella sp. TaxID=104108 RepID=UPI002608B531